MESIEVRAFDCIDQVGTNVYAISNSTVEEILKQGKEPSVIFPLQLVKSVGPTIGIVGLPCLDNVGNKIYAVPTVIVKWILRLGGNPKIIFTPQLEDFVNKKIPDLNQPSIEELKKLRDWIFECDAVIKPGCKRLYPHDNEIYSIVSEYNIPYLGICGGMQLMRNHKIEYMPNVKNETAIEHYSKDTYAHSITLVPGSKLQSILETDTILVNSRHSYHVPDSGLKSVGAYADDGIIEALEDHTKTFNIGVQWHPEIIQDDPNSTKLFSTFIKSARQYQKVEHRRVF